MNTTDIFWKNLPELIREKDSYKDAQGKGLLERYLSIFGLELKDEVIKKLESIINEQDVETAHDEYLSEIAYSVGRPYDLLLDIDKYRILLKQIISIYKIKGTTKSYILLFNLLGMSVTLVEHFPLDGIYDGGLFYDDTSADALHYDDDKCEVGCIEYSLLYKNNPGYTTAPLTPKLQAGLVNMIKDFLEPIDCKLRAITYQP